MASQPDEVIAINLPPDIKERTRTLKSGKTQTRYTVEVRSEPIVHVFNDKELGRKPADVLAQILRENLQLFSFSHPVSASTMKKRRYNASALKRGEKYALRRYSGGRMGMREPVAGAAGWFKDSGRLIESLYPTHNKDEGHYTINVAANRLDRASFGPGFERFLQVFHQALNTDRAAEDRRFREAQISAVDAAIVKAGQRVEAKKAEMLNSAAEALRALRGLG